MGTFCVESEARSRSRRQTGPYPTSTDHTHNTPDPPHLPIHCILISHHKLDPYIYTSIQIYIVSTHPCIAIEQSRPLSLQVNMKPYDPCRVNTHGTWARRGAVGFYQKEGFAVIYVIIRKQIDATFNSEAMGCLEGCAHFALLGQSMK